MKKGSIEHKILCWFKFSVLFPFTAFLSRQVLIEVKERFRIEFFFSQFEYRYLKVLLPLEQPLTMSLLTIITQLIGA